MFIFIVLVFAVCWLPYHGYFIYTHYDRQVLYSKYVQHVYLGFYWFAMANAMVNPLIYYWMNARFRQYFRTALCGWHKLVMKRTQKETDTPNIMRNTNSLSKSGIEQTFMILLYRQSRRRGGPHRRPGPNSTALVKPETSQDTVKRRTRKGPTAALPVKVAKRDPSSTACNQIHAWPNCATCDTAV